MSNFSKDKGRDGLRKVGLLPFDQLTLRLLRENDIKSATFISCPGRKKSEMQNLNLKYKCGFSVTQNLGARIDLTGI